MSTPTEEQINRLQSLLDAGTQGEWVRESGRYDGFISAKDRADIGHFEHSEDALLTASLHNAAPALLEAARENLRLREALEESGVDLSKALIEVAAKRIYNSWNWKDGWVPWQRKGNSDMQFYARQEAQREVEKAMVKTLGKETV